MATVGSLSRLSSAAGSAAAADSVRHDDTRLTDARTPTTHTHAEADTTSLVADLALKSPLASPTFTGTVTAPRIIRPPQTITYAATITPDASLGDQHKVTATGALTINIPTNPTDGQWLLVAVLASGGARTVSLQTGIQQLTGLTLPLVIVNTKVGYIGLRYSVLSGSVWVCMAAGQES